MAHTIGGEGQKQAVRYLVLTGQGPAILEPCPTLRWACNYERSFSIGNTAVRWIQITKKSSNFTLSYVCSPGVYRLAEKKQASQQSSLQYSCLVAPSVSLVVSSPFQQKKPWCLENDIPWKIDGWNPKSWRWMVQIRFPFQLGKLFRFLAFGPADIRAHFPQGFSQ